MYRLVTLKENEKAGKMSSLINIQQKKGGNGFCCKKYFQYYCPVYREVPLKVNDFRVS
jgi:hypothetical protein